MVKWSSLPNLLSEVIKARKELILIYACTVSLVNLDNALVKVSISVIEHNHHIPCKCVASNGLAPFKVLYCSYRDDAVDRSV